MAEDIVEGTHPTRMELLRVKSKLRMAEKGHRLLKEKRDTLVMEFMNLARDGQAISENASLQLKRARHSYAVASALSGVGSVFSAALACQQDINAEVEGRNVMGLTLPRISLEARLRQIDQRGYGLITTHPSIDESAQEYEKAVERLTELAEVEYGLTKLSEEVRKTKRRVNALEYKVIPQLANTRKYIEMRLEELEREGFFMRKIIKKKQGSG